jgi:hypothetical protein
MITVERSGQRSSAQIEKNLKEMNLWFERIQHLESEKNLSWIKS